MKVAELMTHDPYTCRPNDSLNLAAKIMWDNDCGFVPVMGGDSRVVGVLTDRDICMAAYTQGRSLHAIPVETAMAHTVVSCAPEDEISVAETLMRQNRIHRLPVIDGAAKLVGVLSVSDIVRGAKGDAAGRISNEEIAQTLGDLSQPRSHATAAVVFGPEEGELEFVPKPRAKRGQRHK